MNPGSVGSAPVAGELTEEPDPRLGGERQPIPIAMQATDSVNPNLPYDLGANTTLIALPGFRHSGGRRRIHRTERTKWRRNSFSKTTWSAKRGRASDERSRKRTSSSMPGIQEISTRTTWMRSSALASHSRSRSPTAP